ncbi:hypothetical protein AAE478_000879 [Parahypoxylon ruwenzoriense]
MVGFAGRFRKPKSPIALGSSSKDDIILSHTPTTPQRLTPPVLRNFSYPTNIGNSPQPPAFPSSPGAGQTPWDQLGEICNFSPVSVSRAGQTRTVGLEDPFFFKSETEPYSRLDDEGDTLSFIAPSDQFFDRESLSQEEPKPRKKQRRSILSGKSTERSGPKDGAPKFPRGHSLGDRIFTQNSIVPSRLKRNPLGQHKTAVSFDASHFIIFPSGSPDRPMSSSGVPLVDTKLKSLTLTSEVAPSSSLPQEGIRGLPTRLGEEESLLQTTTAMKSLRMNPKDHKKISRGYSESSSDTQEINSSARHNDSIPESVKHKGKNGKSSWLSNLKGWVSISEPSTQALKDYKKETYKKANIALDDPQAKAKLHLPVGTLPPDAIKPDGRGPDPEEIALKKIEWRKRTRESYSRTSRTSQGSTSNTSRHSSPSGVAFGAAKRNSR